MFCIACGVEIDSGVKFCPSCGAAQQTDSAATHAVKVKKEASIPEYPEVLSDLADKYGKLSTDELLKVGEGKEPIAWVTLGKRYQSGEGVEKSNDEAFKCYQKASKEGDALGIYNLGRAYAHGHGVEKDEHKAAEFYGKAARLGLLDAMGSYGWVLGRGCGVEKDLDKSARWYRLGAERGNALCQFNLGWCFQYGSGIEQDDAKAVYWYQKAAKQKDSEGLLNLGWMYSRGVGVEKDLVKAHELYMKAAEAGQSSAMCNVAQNYKTACGVIKDLRKANEWYRKAADTGNDRAMCSLGYNYERGLGVQKDLNTAKEWYQKAAEKGNLEAEFRARFAHVDLKDFGKFPKKVKDVNFQRISGIVLDHKRNSETHVSSYGGGGYVGQYGGHVESAQIQSHVTTTDDFWVEDQYGNEQHISLTNKNVSLRAGQEISIFVMFFGQENSGSIVLLVNHSDGNVHRFNDWEKRISAGKEGTHKSVVMRLAGVYVGISLLVMITGFETLFFWVAPLFYLGDSLFFWVCCGVVAFLVWGGGFWDKRKVKNGIISHIASIESWVKSKL